MKKSTTSSDLATEISLLRRSIPSDFANEIVNAQPMDEDILTTLTTLYNGSKTESELKDDGYEPVSPMGLMWVKKI
tara:strand:+ start:2479 stop:2706 length:228 start_codon:yes stop_codon:yes gene_type:complete